MRVLLADDHSIIRKALRHVVGDINPQAEVVETSSFAGLEQLLGGTFDLVVLDLRMPGYEGHDQVRRIVEAMAPRPVAIFSMCEDVQEMQALMSLGVRAFIPKSTDYAVLGGVLRIVLAGGTYVPPALGLAALGASSAMPVSAAAMAAGDGDGEDAALEAGDGALARLTRRQREVMELLGEGLSNNEICARLGLNLSTVKAHVSGVLKALGVDSRTQAALRIREMARQQ